MWSLKTQNALTLKLVFLLDVALLCFLLGAAIIGLMIGLNIRDPVRETTAKAWGEYDSPTAAQELWRQTFWDGQVCTSNLVDECETTFAADAQLALDSVHANYTDGKTQVRHLFADCDYAKQGYSCTLDADDVDVCASRTAGRSDCETVVPGSTTYGCLYIPAEGDTAESCVPKPDCVASEALHGACVRCNADCKEFAIEQAQDNLLPASYIVYAVFAFCMICIIINDELTNFKKMESFWSTLGIIFNGLLAFTGLALFVAAAIGVYFLSDDCVSDSLSDCSNPAIWFVALLGLALLVVGGMATLIIKKDIESTIGCLGLDAANLVLLGISLPLLVCGIALSISAGGINSIHSTFDKHYPEMRKSVELKDENYCKTTAADGTMSEMSDDECRQKMTDALESQILTVGVVALLTAVGMVVVILFTKRSIGELSRSDEGDEKEMAPEQISDDDDTTGDISDDDA